MGALIKFGQLVAIAAKYGARVVAWCWAHKAQIISWFNNGMTVAWVLHEILKALGLA